MSHLENGMLVQHASLGLGKVVALEPKAVHVFFATSDARFATKLRLPLALPLLTPAASTNAWLSRLSGFALDAKTGRYGLAGTWLSHADAVVRFLEVFPKGFADPSYAGEGTAGARARPPVAARSRGLRGDARGRRGGATPCGGRRRRAGRACPPGGAARPPAAQGRGEGLVRGCPEGSRRGARVLRGAARPAGGAGARAVPVRGARRGGRGHAGRVAGVRLAAGDAPAVRRAAGSPHAAPAPGSRATSRTGSGSSSPTSRGPPGPRTRPSSDPPTCSSRSSGRSGRAITWTSTRSCTR